MKYIFDPEDMAPVGAHLLLPGKADWQALLQLCLQRPGKFWFNEAKNNTETQGL
jgi:hypothetical protein